MSSDFLYDTFSGMSEAEALEQLVPMIRGLYIFAIVVQVLMLIIAGVTAHKKGRSVIGCLILTWFLGLIGLIIVACMRSKKTAPTSSARTSSSGGSATFGRSSGSSSSSTARPSGSSSATPTPTFGRGSGASSSSGSSSSSARPTSNGFTSAIGSSGSSSGKKGFGIKMCPHCGSAVSSRHCAMCGKDNNLF